MLSDESFGEKFGHRMFVLLLACVNRILSNVLHLLGYYLKNLSVVKYNNLSSSVELSTYS